MSSEATAVWQHSSTTPRRSTGRRTGSVAAVTLRSLIFGSVAIIISGFGHALSHPARGESREAAAVVAAIVDGETRNAVMSAELTDDLGYEPVAAEGRMMSPQGSCSTPLPLGPEAFEDACQTHDFGYDLLRVAEEEGLRLGAWARFELDWRLYLDLLARCDTDRCRTLATAYYTAVTTNSIRQGYRAPTEEPTTPWVGLGLAVVGIAVIVETRGAIGPMARRAVGMGRKAPTQEPRDRYAKPTPRLIVPVGHLAALLPGLKTVGPNRRNPDRFVISSHRRTIRGTV